MPITFNMIGNNLNSEEVDSNFKKLRSLLNEQVKNQDINDESLNRWIVRRGEGGRVESASTREVEFSDYFQSYDQALHAYHEVTWSDRRSLVQDLGSNPPAVRRENLMMEFLGRPGPSFYWDWMEDGITGVAASIPSLYPNDVCYSYWLTIPGASRKLYVPDKCVAHVDASFYGLTNYTHILDYLVNGPGATFADNVADWTANKESIGSKFSMRIGLFVDTNPFLFDDEFQNLNPNIVSNGSQAPYCSWNRFAHKSINCPMWVRERIEGAVALKGGRWYNFSLKYRLAGYVGYNDGGFVNNVYEYGKGTPAGTSLPNFSGGYQRSLGVPPFEVQFVSSAMKIELFYGYDSVRSR